LSSATFSSLQWQVSPAPAAAAHAKPLAFMSTFLPDSFNDWAMRALTKTLLKQHRRKSADQAS
jgi:hypothetical protein